MARIALEIAAEQAQSVVQANGGEMSHNSLVQTLESNGQAQTAGMLMELRRAGYLVFRVDYDVEAQVSTLMVTLP